MNDESSNSSVSPSPADQSTLILTTPCSINDSLLCPTHPHHDHSGDIRQEESGPHTRLDTMGSNDCGVVRRV